MTPDRKCAFSFALGHRDSHDLYGQTIRRIKNKHKQLLFSQQHKAVAVRLRTGQNEVWLICCTVKMQKSF